MENSLSTAFVPFVATDAIAAVARSRPDAIALIVACGTLSYAELDRRANRLAHWLRGQGVGPESVVGLCLERSFDQITAALATWKAGGAYLPLDPAWPDARLRQIAGEARCALVLGREDIHARLAGVSVNAQVFDGAILASPDFSAEAPDVAVDPSALAYVIYTSGSTGTPKGVEVTHGNLAHLVWWHNAAFAVTAEDRGSHLAGLGFDAAVWEIWPYLCAGASLALADDAVRTSAELLHDWLIARQVTVAFAPTALATGLIAMDWPADTKLRILLTGADRLLARPRAGQPFTFVNNYGPTECAVVATSGTIAPEGEGLPPIGAAIGETKLRIIDGELYIGGPSVARGYRDRPDLTAERFVTIDEERFYRSGDRAELLPDGQLAFHGRVDDQVKIRGNRVEPDEVASVVRRHPAIRDAAVIARDDMLAAYLVCDATLRGEELRGFLAERLPEYMVPGAFVRIERLPLTANGKIDKAALPDPETAETLAGAGYAAPETVAEERLVEILVELLGRSPVGIDDNFFLLGGHSLLGTQVVLRAGDAFGVELTLRDLFLAPTVRQLGERIESLLLAMLEEMSDEEAALRAGE